MYKIILILLALVLSGCAEKQPDMRLEIFTTNNRIQIVLPDIDSKKKNKGI